MRERCFPVSDRECAGERRDGGFLRFKKELKHDKIQSGGCG